MKPSIDHIRVRNLLTGSIMTLSDYFSYNRSTRHVQYKTPWWAAEFFMAEGTSDLPASIAVTPVPT